MDNTLASPDTRRSLVPQCALHFDTKRPAFALWALAHLLTSSRHDSVVSNAITLVPTTVTTATAALPRLEFTNAHAQREPHLVGLAAIYRYLARLVLVHPELSTAPLSLMSRLYGDTNSTTGPQQAAEIDAIVSLVTSPSFLARDTLVANAALLNDTLVHSTFLCGHFLTIADLAAFDALQSNVRWAAFSKPISSGNSSVASLSSYPSLERWHRDVRSQPALAQHIAQQEQWLKSSESTIKHEKSVVGAGFDSIDLGEAIEGQVTTRFPPEPSGYLHIGHAKAALLNHIIAKKFKGRLILRFDDTNPKKEKEEYVQSILEDLRLLGIEWDLLTHTSDHFDLILSYGERMLRANLAYVDMTPVEEMRRQRGEGEENMYRHQSVEENLRLWAEMLAGSVEGKKCAVRAKIDMQYGNKAMRDPTIFRCNDQPHHRTGTKYKCYPTYDFACPIVDSIEGVTHALRTNEYRDRNEQYYWMIDALGLRKPLIRDYSRLNFVYTTLSKRKLTWFVDTHKVSGWNDPRFPTIRGMIRRGLTVEALREFMVAQGFTTGSNMMEYDKIWTINKRIIDASSRRFTAIAKANAASLTLHNLVTDDAGFLSQSLLCLPKDDTANPKYGFKVITKSNHLLLEHEDAKALSVKEEVTLMNIGNVIVDSIATSPSSTAITATWNPTGSVKMTEKKLTWLDAHPLNAADLVPITLVELDMLITVAKVQEDMNFDDIVNPNTWFETEAWGEPAMRSIRQGEIIQLNRRGFFIADSVHVSSAKGLILIAIPDGRTKTASTLSSKVDPAKLSGRKKD